MNYEIWNYTHINVETNPAAFIPLIGLFFMGTTASVSSLTVTFDDQGIVQSILTSNSESTSGMGAGNQKTYNPK